MQHLYEIIDILVLCAIESVIHPPGMLLVHSTCNALPVSKQQTNAPQAVTAVAASALTLE
jgi:hypothetical protein